MPNLSPQVHQRYPKLMMLTACPIKLFTEKNMRQICVKDIKRVGIADAEGVANYVFFLCVLFKNPQTHKNIYLAKYFIGFGKKMIYFCYHFLQEPYFKT